MQLAMIGDKIIPLEQLGPEYQDRGLFFGDGVYEVIRSYNGRIFAIDDHLKRFERSMSEVGITGLDIKTVRSRVLSAFEKSGITDAKIYFHITRGSEMRNHSAIRHLTPNFLLTISHVPDSSSEKARGIAVSTFPDWRWKRCDIKSLNLLANVLARTDAEKKGCSEAILVDSDGMITEGSASGFFSIKDRKIITRPLGTEILASITRKHIIHIASQTDLIIEENTITPEQAANADELFLAVTTKDIVPVVTFDGRRIADGKVGPYTKQLIDLFKKLTEQE